MWIYYRMNHAIYFFVGRTNPPHPGHIATIRQMVEEANHRGKRALVFLGDGSQTDSVIKDPIDFELKRDIVVYKLFSEYGLNYGEHYEIIQKTPEEPIPRLRNEVGAIAAAHATSSNVNVEMFHYAGEKGDDVIKFNHMKPYLIPTGHEDVNIDFKNVGVRPIKIAGEEPFSSTIVREYAYEKTQEEWNAHFSSFYGPYADMVYLHIIAAKEAVDVKDDVSWHGTYEDAYGRFTEDVYRLLARKKEGFSQISKEDYKTMLSTVELDKGVLVRDVTPTLAQLGDLGQRVTLVIAKLFKNRRLEQSKRTTGKSVRKSRTKNRDRSRSRSRSRSRGGTRKKRRYR